VDAGVSEFADFVAAREAALQRSAWLLTGDWGLAQDLVQTSLARVWPRWERMTDRQRIVVVRRIFDDLTEAQVAQVLGCAVGTVKSTMSQALAKLRDDPWLAELLDREIR
jgi:DNA-directed RNA polymerase specialized sigma24 family protein